MSFDSMNTTSQQPRRITTSTHGHASGLASELEAPQCRMGCSAVASLAPIRNYLTWPDVWLGYLQQGVLQCVCCEVLFCAQRSFAHGVSSRAHDLQSSAHERRVSSVTPAAPASSWSHSACRTLAHLALVLPTIVRRAPLLCAVGYIRIFDVCDGLQDQIRFNQCACVEWRTWI